VLIQKISVEAEQLSRRARKRPLAKWSGEHRRRVIDLFAPIYKNSALSPASIRFVCDALGERDGRAGRGLVPKSPRLQPRLTGWNIFDLQLMRASTYHPLPAAAGAAICCISNHFSWRVVQNSFSRAPQGN
jgi:hypothetical protein